MSRQSTETTATETSPATPPDDTVIDVEFEITTIIDGYIVNDQGEILGLAEIDGEEKPVFRVRDEDSANWVMKLRFDEEAKLKDLAARKAALMANIEGMETSIKARLRYLERRFDQELIQWAKERLQTIRGKTVKLIWGSIGFRTSKGSAAILDPDRSLHYVEEWAPHHVKKTVGIEAIRAAMEAERQAEQTPDVSEFFDDGKPGQKITITSGIK